MQYLIKNKMNFLQSSYYSKIYKILRYANKITKKYTLCITAVGVLQTNLFMKNNNNILSKHIKDCNQHTRD